MWGSGSGVEGLGFGGLRFRLCDVQGWGDACHVWFHGEKVPAKCPSTQRVSRSTRKRVSP